MKTTGILKSKIAPKKGVSKAGKEWIKQDFIIDTGDQYNPIACFGVFGQQKVDTLNTFNEGYSIDIQFNIQCREYKGNYYTNLDAWKIERTAQANAPNPPAKEDDLPF